MASKAKKHQILADISGALSGKLPEITVEVLGHLYILRLLKPEGDDWVAANTVGSTFAAALMNSRNPIVAASLVSIDGLPVEQLFSPDETMDARMKETLMAESKLIREWRREQVLDWVREELDPYVVGMLYDGYQKLIPQHREAMQEVGNFSKRTTSAV